MKARVKFNKAALDNKIKEAEDKAYQQVENQLKDMAEFAVSRSPVDTGAYVTSFSIKNNYSSGRGRTSKNKPRNQSPQAKRQEGYVQMAADIEGLDLKNSKVIVLSNGSPHARLVETGEAWSRTPGYAVFAQIKDRFR